MSSWSRNAQGALAAAAVAALAAPLARAANWQFLPRIEAGATYNDNYRLADTSLGRITVYGPYINAQLNMDLLSPRSKIEFVPRVYSTYFPTDHADQSTDEYLDFDGYYTGLRSNFTWLAHYSNETVITSELLPATFPGVSLGEEAGGISGRVSVRNRRQLVRVTPKYTYDLTERTHLDLQANLDRTRFSNTLYHQQGAYEQIGYNAYSGRFGLDYDLTPRSNISVIGVAARFLPQLGGHDTNRYGVDLEWKVRETQIMQFYARAGATRSQAHTSVGTVSSTGFSGGVGVDLRYQITEFTIDALRAVRPSEVGAEIVYDQLRLRVLRAFEPLLSGFLGVRALRLRGVSSSRALQVDGEDYYTAEAGLVYQLTENFRMQGAYTYIWQRFQGSPSASSSGIAISFIYQPLSQYQPLPEFTGIPQEQLP